MSGEIEIDESYFGAKRVRGKRGRGANRKTPVFGMLKRNGCVYTQVVKNCSAKELMPIIKDFAELGESEVFSDSWKAYDGLVDFLFRFHSQLCKKVQRLIIGSSIVKMSLQMGEIISME